MAAPRRPSNPARQVKQHLDALKAAGVEWLPKPKPKSPATTALATPIAESLFDEPKPPPVPSPARDAGLSLEERRKELQVLEQCVSSCPRCPELVATRTQTVFGTGPAGAEVCFIGEAPGADEDKQGEPFVGAAGQLLNKILAACGFTREEVYICNIIKCRPPGNRTPKPEEATNCREYLDAQLALLHPTYIVALGGTAAQSLLGITAPLGKLRGKFHDYKGTPVLCTYHPAFLLPHRQPAKKKDVWDDMKMLLARMGRPVPK